MRRHNPNDAGAYICYNYIGCIIHGHLRVRVYSSYVYRAHTSAIFTFLYSVMASPPLRMKQPDARRCHAAVSEEQNMLVWGGENPHCTLKTSTLEIFNVLSAVWQDSQQFRGQPLYDGHRGMAVASDGEKAYMFGGTTGPFGTQKHCNTLYQFDLTSLECAILEPSIASVSPSAADGSRMVCANRKLVLYGGFTDANLPSDELLMFGLNTSEISFIKYS